MKNKDRVISHEIIQLKEYTPNLAGRSQLLKIGGKYFRSWDAESYASGIDEITEEEFDRLLKYKIISKEEKK